MYGPTRRKQARKVSEGWSEEGTGRCRHAVGKRMEKREKDGNEEHRKGAGRMLEPHSFSFASD